LKFGRTENFLGFVKNYTICRIVDWVSQAEINLFENQKGESIGPDTPFNTGV
jgi:hypothetical protein